MDTDEYYTKRRRILEKEYERELLNRTLSVPTRPNVKKVKKTKQLLLKI